MLKKQKKLYRRYCLSGFKSDKVAIDKQRDECYLAIKQSKENYIKNLGNKLIDKKTGPKVYWKIINNLLVVGKIITNCQEKDKLFNDYFLLQCKPINNNSALPDFNLVTKKRLDNIKINPKQISDIIKNLNVNKAHGPNEISGRMIEICGENITLPLSIIFNNIIKTGIFPDLWKCANVSPVHKKNSKQEIKNYRPISLLPLFAKIFERILFLHMHNFFYFKRTHHKKTIRFSARGLCNKSIDLSG